MALFISQSLVHLDFTLRSYEREGPKKESFNTKNGAGCGKNLNKDDDGVTSQPRGAQGPYGVE